MNTPAEIVTPLIDDGRRAAAAFLTRYGAVTRRSYTSDLRAWFTWCHDHHLLALAVSRPHVELWVRDMRDVQIVARHADPRTTTRNDRARNNLDRHASCIVTAFVAGAA